MATSSPSLSMVLILKQAFFSGIGTWGAMFLVLMPGQFALGYLMKKYQEYKAKHPVVVDPRNK